MATKSNRITIITASIGAFAVIIAAIIQIRPWKKDSSHVMNNKVVFHLRGTVIDDKSNQNIPQAEIDVVGRNEQYYTEENGNFEIAIKDSVKSIRIRVIKKEYLPYDKSYDLPSEGVIIQLSKVQHD
jgi:hypothetical protein